MTKEKSKMPKIPNFSEVKEERTRLYRSQANELYPKLKLISNEEYRIIRNEFESGNKDVLVELSEKSIQNIIDSVVSIFVQYDIEPVVSFEDALSLTLINFHSSVLNFKKLPRYYSEYNSTLQYFAYNIICFYYQREKDLIDTITYLDQPSLIKEMNRKFACVPSTHEENKAYFEMKFKKATRQLNERQIAILRIYYGLDDGEGKTFYEIGEIFGITRARVDQIMKAAFAKIQRPKNIKHLIDLNELKF